MKTAITGYKGKRLKKEVKTGLGIGIFIILLIITFPVARKIANTFHQKSRGTVRVDRYKDLNEIHLRHAKSNGIEPFTTDKAFNDQSGKLVSKDKLVKIRNNKYYFVNKLGHSHPYLTPDAADLLEKIGKQFHSNLEKKNLDKYQFRISSLLRTMESQKRLSHSNRNASPNTAHLYGTTFDISYKNLIKQKFMGKNTLVTDAEALKCLSEAIGTLRKDGKLVVVTEIKEACFHITSTY